MSPDNLISRLLQHQKSVQSIIRLLREISRLDQDRAANLVRLRERLVRLEKLCGTEQDGPCLKEVADWISQYRSLMDETMKLLRKRFGIELEQELDRLGFPLSGQYPDLKVGLFTIEVDFEQMRATIWYGPKQERLGECVLSASKLAACLLEKKRKLGSGLPEEQLLQTLCKAYDRVRPTTSAESVPIAQVLGEMARSLEVMWPVQEAKRGEQRRYTRADFSYDLYRIRQFQASNPVLVKVHLSVATRAHTRRRCDFLWVPDDESGKGAAYSHLTCREVKDARS